MTHHYFLEQVSTCQSVTINYKGNKLQSSDVIDDVTTMVKYTRWCNNQSKFHQQILRISGAILHNVMILAKSINRCSEKLSSPVTIQRVNSQLSLSQD